VCGGLIWYFFKIKKKPKNIIQTNNTITQIPQQQIPQQQIVQQQIPQQISNNVFEIPNSVSNEINSNTQNIFDKELISKINNIQMI
jgi:hypothetical protein